MKKNYISPTCMDVTVVQTDSLLTTVSADDIRFGGTDNGSHAAGGRRGGWDSDEEW